MRSMIRPVAIALALSGCGAPAPHTAADGTPLVDGFDPKAPGPGEIQVITPIFKGIASGTDVTYCSYLDFHASKTMDVTSYLGFQSRGGHHTILYSTANSQTPNTHVCTDNDMFNVQYVGGGGTDSTIAASKIPPGIAFRIQQGSQLMLLSHWINATGQSVDGQAAYNIAVQDPTPEVAPGDLFTVVRTDFSLPIGQSTVHNECVLKQDLQFFLIGGHAHEYASRITLTHMPASGGPTVMYDQPWNKTLIFDTPLNNYTKEMPYVMHAGDHFVVDCTYQNTTDKPIMFPTEMCVGFGYFFPATAEIDCVDGNWPSN